MSETEPTPPAAMTFTEVTEVSRSYISKFGPSVTPSRRMSV